MIAASGSLGVLGVIFVRPLMLLGCADLATLPLAVRYARIIFLGLIAMELVPSIGGMLNATGAPQVMLGMTLFSTGTLLVAEPLLVRWMDLEGAALALVGSNTVGMLWGLTVLLTGRAPVRLELHNLHLDLAMKRRILRVAPPAVLLRGAPYLALADEVNMAEGLTRFFAGSMVALRLSAAIPTAALPGVPASRGRSVGQIPAHIYNNRLNWLEHAAPELMEAPVKVGKERSRDKASLPDLTSPLRPTKIV
jgi:hypothetical protein